MIFSHRGRKHFLKNLFKVTNLAEEREKEKIKRYPCFNENSEYFFGGLGETKLLFLKNVMLSV